MQTLYEKPLKVELAENQVFVDGKPHKRDARKLSELKDVLRGRVVPDFEGDPDIYYMFRQVYKKDGMRFDITVIPAMAIQGECAKTYGHSHPPAEDGLSYPEVYQVLSGTAIFLLQRANRDRSVDVALIKADAGQILLIPPNHAHVTINPADTTLVLANVVANGFDSDYSEFKENRGAAFYYLSDGNIEQNAAYVVKDMSRPTPAEFNKRFGFACKDILSELDSRPEKFAFLKKPSVLFRSTKSSHY